MGTVPTAAASRSSHLLSRSSSSFLNKIVTSSRIKSKSLLIKCATVTTRIHIPGRRRKGIAQDGNPEHGKERSKRHAYPAGHQAGNRLASPTGGRTCCTGCPRATTRSSRPSTSSSTRRSRALGRAAQRSCLDPLRRPRPDHPARTPRRAALARGLGAASRTRRPRETGGAGCVSPSIHLPPRPGDDGEDRHQHQVPAQHERRVAVAARCSSRIAGRREPELRHEHRQREQPRGGEPAAARARAGRAARARSGTAARAPSRTRRRPRRTPAA